jgi:rhodanese-related sulfurtransferase
MNPEDFNNPNGKKNKNNLIIIIGILLLLAVCLFTLFKNVKKEKDTAEDNLPQAKINSSNSISGSDLQKKIRAKENLLIIDIRDENDFLSEHIQDSINIPFSQLSGYNLTDDGKIFILVDYADSTQSAQALQILKNKQMKNVFILSGGITTWMQNQGSVISYGDPTSFTDQAKVTYISSEDLKKMIAGSYSPFIIDIRNANSFSEGRIPKANNIFLDNLETMKDKIPSGQPIVAYGATGLDGFQAGVRLYDLGLFSVKVLKGGFADWQTKEFTIEK